MQEEYLVFADKQITIPVVNPERTFLEKIFLLHEEFQKHSEKIRVDRLSRHLYDIEKLMDTEFAQIALSDNDLYTSIVEHRKSLTPIRGIDYEKHSPNKICIIPPLMVINEWEKDYKVMQNNMIYGNSLSFKQLLTRIEELQSRINDIK